MVGSDITRVARLRDVAEISPEGLLPYQSEIRAIEEMYKSIWQFHVFLESSWFDKQPVVEWALERELGFPNDRLLTEELAHEPASPFGILARELTDEVAPRLIPSVIQGMDARIRMRHGESSDPRAWIRSIISSVAAQEQLRLPGTDANRS